MRKNLRLLPVLLTVIACAFLSAAPISIKSSPAAKSVPCTLSQKGG